MPRKHPNDVCFTASPPCSIVAIHPYGRSISILVLAIRVDNPPHTRFLSVKNAAVSQLLKLTVHEDTLTATVVFRSRQDTRSKVNDDMCNCNSTATCLPAPGKMPCLHYPSRAPSMFALPKAVVTVFLSCFPVRVAMLGLWAEGTMARV